MTDHDDTTGDDTQEEAVNAAEEAANEIVDGAAEEPLPESTDPGMETADDAFGVEEDLTGEDAVMEDPVLDHTDTDVQISKDEFVAVVREVRAQNEKASKRIAEVLGGPLDNFDVLFREILTEKGEVRPIDEVRDMSAEERAGRVLKPTRLAENIEVDVDTPELFKRINEAVTDVCGKFFEEAGTAIGENEPQIIYIEPLQVYCEMKGFILQITLYTQLVLEL